MNNKEQLNCKVIMLPTNKAENSLYINNTNGKIDYHKGYLTQDYLHNSLNATSQHIYLVSNREIKENNWYIYKKKLIKAIMDSSGMVLEELIYKVEATTDPSLRTTTKDSMGTRFVSSIENQNDQIPQIPQSFIEAYVKANGKIDEVNIEVEFSHYTPESESKYVQNLREDNSILVSVYKIKTREDNTVIIHQSRMYTREEMYESFKAGAKFMATEGKIYKRSPEFDKWIEENL